MYLTDYPKVTLYVVYGSKYENPITCSNPQFKEIVGVFDDKDLATKAESNWLSNNPWGEVSTLSRILNEVLE